MSKITDIEKTDALRVINAAMICPDGTNNFIADIIRRIILQHSELESGIAGETEKCAQICDELAKLNDDDDDDDDAYIAAFKIAASAIRKRLE